MPLPDRIDTESQLEDVLAEPSAADVECVARLDGDILILGAAGKMGPSLARRVHRASARAGRRGGGFPLPFGVVSQLATIEALVAFLITGRTVSFNSTAFRRRTVPFRPRTT